MNLEQQIRAVTAYLDSQGMFITNIEFGKFGNGTAQLCFKFEKNSFSNDQAKELLVQFAKKSIKITKIDFLDDADDSNLAIAHVACTYDFTQELDKEEIEKVNAAKGKKTDGLTGEVQSVFTDQYYSARLVYKDGKGKYYATPFITSDSDRNKLKGKTDYTKEITEAQYNNPQGNDVLWSETKPYSC